VRVRTVAALSAAVRIRTARGAGFAASATLLVHWIAYRITLADPVERAHLLEETGHSWLGWSLPIAIVALAVTVTGVLLNHRTETRATTRNSIGNRRGRSSDAVLLYLAAAGSFLGVELFERWHHLGDLDAVAANLLTRTGGLPVLLGILLLAAISPLFLAAERAIRRVLGERRRTQYAPVRTPVPTAVRTLIALLHLGTCPTRGPPLLSGPGISRQH
jgi:uncharacterized integral membrane protein